MSSGDTMTRNEGFTVVPKWNEEASSLDSFDNSVNLYVMGTKKEDRYLCGPRALAQMDREKQPLQGDSGRDHKCAVHSRVVLISSCQALQGALGTKLSKSSAILPTADGGLARETVESMRKWTSRVEGFVKRTGAALHKAGTNIDPDTVCPHTLGIMLLVCSQ